MRPRADLAAIVRRFNRLDPMQVRHSRTIVVGPGDRPMLLSVTQSAVMLELIVADDDELARVAAELDQELSGFELTVNWEDLPEVPAPFR